MLEKNKDYIEMRVSSTDCGFAKNEAARFSIEGYSDVPYWRLPNPGESYVIISKEKFDQLQAKAKDAEKYAKCIDDMEEACQDYRNTIEDLKKKLAEFEPAPGYRDFLKALYPEEDVEKLVWVTKQVCGRDLRHTLQVDLEYYRALSSAQAKSIYCWKESTGCETPDEAKEHLSKLKNEPTHIVYLNDPLGVIAKWEKVTGYNEPKDFLKWKANIEGIMEAWKDATGCKYPGDARRLLEKWQTMTRSETPENAAKWLERFEETDKRCSELKVANKALGDTVESWKHVTGYSNPEDYITGKILTVYCDMKDLDDVWKEATDCDSPQAAKEKLDHYKRRLGNAVQAASCAAKHLENITF